jgi:hypothetical protein
VRCTCYATICVQCVRSDSLLGLAIEQNDGNAQREWLTYWVAYGCFTGKFFCGASREEWDSACAFCFSQWCKPSTISFQALKHLLTKFSHGYYHYCCLLCYSGQMVLTRLLCRFPHYYTMKTMTLLWLQVRHDVACAFCSLMIMSTTKNYYSVEAAFAHCSSETTSPLVVLQLIRPLQHPRTRGARLMYQRWVLLSRSILRLFSVRTSRFTLRSCIRHSACSCPQSAPLLLCTSMSFLFAQLSAKIIVSHLQFHFPHAHASSGHYRGCRPPSILYFVSLPCLQSSWRRRLLLVSFLRCKLVDNYSNRVP